jgi:hypothetical protein
VVEEGLLGGAGEREIRYVTASPFEFAAPQMSDTLLSDGVAVTVPGAPGIAWGIKDPDTA